MKYLGFPLMADPFIRHITLMVRLTQTVMLMSATAWKLMVTMHMFQHSSIHISWGAMDLEITLLALRAAQLIQDLAMSFQEIVSLSLLDRLKKLLLG